MKAVGVLDTVPSGSGETRGTSSVSRKMMNMGISPHLTPRTVPSLLRQDGNMMCFR